MTGEDKYGRPIPMQLRLRIMQMKDLRLFQPQQMWLSLVFRGKTGPEEAISQSLELPLKYTALIKLVVV